MKNLKIQVEKYGDRELYVNLRGVECRRRVHAERGIVARRFVVRGVHAHAVQRMMAEAVHDVLPHALALVARQQLGIILLRNQLLEFKQEEKYLFHVARAHEAAQEELRFRRVVSDDLAELHGDEGEYRR